MKKELFKILILQLLFLGNLMSQDFAPTGAKWYFPTTHFFSSNIGLVTYTSIGDTIIDSKTAKIIFKDNSTCYGSGGNYYFHQSNDSIFEYDQLNELFELSFILNAQVGTKWTINESLGSPYEQDSMECRIDSISYIDLDSGDSLRVQHVVLTSFNIFEVINGDTLFEEHPNRIIEKIGFSKAISPVYYGTICDEDYEDDIRCYEDIQLGLINFTSNECLLTPTQEVQHDEINIFPNPVSSHFSVEGEVNNIERIEIFNLQGQKVMTIKNGFERIETSVLSKGVYFLEIISKNDSVVSEKIIVEK